ncbi:MAG TPA: hypothetical protein VGV59_03380 [Pyrinomonadaceae bacterium]|nr:hypothetical protein [Pyrinomonadaceae bacterium]
MDYRTVLDYLRQQLDPYQPVSEDDVARLNLQLSELHRELDARSAKVQERQQALNAMQRTLDDERREISELAAVIARGQELSEWMSVRVPLKLLPKITIEIVEDPPERQEVAA